MSGTLYISRNDLIEAIGEEATSALLELAGGGSVYIARSPRPQNSIKAGIGEEAYGKLQAAIGSGRGGLWLSLPSSIPLVTLRDQVALRTSEGRSEDEIAREFRVNIRTVRRHRAKSRAAQERRPDNCPGHAPRQ